MAAALAHRGPDDAAVVTLGSAGFAHRRLAIVDRTSAGAQPMANADRSLWITYNGEMYNHDDERRHLEARGHRFRSRSDTEVILGLYQEYGEACLDRLQGMFALAIWDAPRRRLFLARDRFGKKPLYYVATPRRIVFASEIKALLASDEPPPPVDTTAIHHFLSFDYVPSPRTAFQGIAKLPAGHAAAYERGDLSVRRYFAPSYAVARSGRSPDETDRDLRDALGTAIRRRLTDEVPMGVFLSGGIDSSAIVAMLAEAGGTRIRTFTMGWQDAGLDERPFARLVADRYGTDHHEFVITPDLASELPRVLRQFDEPFGDPSALPTFLLAGAARREITVALTGDGGDEAFAGYDRYVKNALAERYLHVPRPVRRAVGRLLMWAVPGTLPFEHPLRQIARFASIDKESLGALYCRWLLHFDAEQKRDLYTPEFQALMPEPSCAVVERLWQESDGSDATARELATDVASYLPDDLLVKADITSMAHGLEVRCPFLDQDLVALAMGLPSREKLRGTRGKWALKRALRGRLPAAILSRPKTGFGLPIDRWLRGELRPLLHDVLLSPRAASRGYFRREAVRRLVAEHESGRRSWAYHLWNLVALELWHLDVVDTRRAGTP